MHPEIARALARHTVIARRDHPGRARHLSHLAACGELVAVLPGVYARPPDAQTLHTRAAAACCYDPDGVIVGDAAAALTYGPELRPAAITVAGRMRRLRRPGWVFVERQVPQDLVRTRRATLAEMHRALALTPSRHGNTDRRMMLLDSRDAPFSEAERLAHRLLRQAGITG